MIDDGDETRKEPNTNPDLNVADKRRFNADGTPRDEEVDQPSNSAVGETDGDPTEKEPQPQFRHRPKREPTEIDFSGFALSLAQAALVDLGVAPHPERDRIQKDLPQARNTIDILGILREKTTGNLTDDETKLLDGLLYQLRLVFLESK